MKKVLTLSLIAIGMVASLAVNASERFNVAISGQEMINISLTKVSKGEHLVIKDFKGNSLYNKTLKAMNAFEKNFSLRPLSKGVYFVELENEFEIRITPVLKNDYGVTLIEKATKRIFKPQFKQNENIFSFSMVNSQSEEVDLSIYDENGRVLMSETDIKEVIISRAYNTSQLSKGNYVVVISKGRRRFNEEFEVR